MTYKSIVPGITIEEARALIEERESAGIKPTIETCWICLELIHHGGEWITVKGKQRRKHKRCKPVDKNDGLIHEPLGDELKEACNDAEKKLKKD